MRKPIYKLDQIFADSNRLDSLKSNFTKLDQLNLILKELLPQNLSDLCHVGAIDNPKNAVVIFMAKQSAFYHVRNLSGIILDGFKTRGYDFDALLIKVSKDSLSQAKPIAKKKPLDEKTKQSLNKLNDLLKVLQDK